MSTISKVWYLAAAAARAELQYRSNFLITMLGGVAYQGVGLAFIWVVLERFGTIGGWTLAEIAFLYGLRLAAHGLWCLPFSQLLHIDFVVRTGEYDRYLVRPLNPLLQLLTNRISLPTLGDFLGGIVLLAVAASLAPVDWSPQAIGFMLLAVVGGALVEVSIQLAVSGLVFRLLSTVSLKIALDQVNSEFGNYPMKIFTPAVRFGLTFVLPVAFVAYLPATVLLNRAGELAVPAWLAWCSPLIGAPLFALAYLFWTHQSRHYSSSGH